MLVAVTGPSMEHLPRAAAPARSAALAQAAWLALAGCVIGSLMGSVTGCASTPSSIVSVDVRTGLVPGPEFRFVTIEVFDGDGSGAWNRVMFQEAPAAFGDDFADGVRVTELDLEPGLHRVTVRLLRADRRLLVALSKVVAVQAGESRVSVFRLTRDCVGDVVCPNPGGSAALTECLGGQCVDPRCEPPDPTYCPDVIFCNADAECPPVAPCASSRCADGICVEQPIDGACAVGDYCHPGLGCTSLEAPVDPRTPECGEFCEGPCTAGLWTCDAMGARCSVVGFKDAGVPCGTAGQCDGEGACIEP